ncbi:hypothetical protein OG194_38165 [Streptomyces sp. NBC_01288]|uniref:hypothetical protein n=1 Tax=Streptomyces sp. NBC_01288 TaxID=2903814 RepID=UPI002E10715D|nr:hypothetical protein OG194_38165 [Streptomyces sp. NBC_01288]
MQHILDTPGRLTDRGRRFLAARARTVPFPTRDNPDDTEVIARLAPFPEADATVLLAGLRQAQHRYGGLVYPTSAWSFQEEIRFQPWPSFEKSAEHGPLAGFIAHEVAHPTGFAYTCGGRSRNCSSRRGRPSGACGPGTR